MLCYYMVLRCLVEAKDYTEAANIINSEINPTSCNVSLQQDVKSHDNLTYFNVSTTYTTILLMLKLKFKQKSYAIGSKRIVLYQRKNLRSIGQQKFCYRVLQRSS